MYYAKIFSLEFDFSSKYLINSSDTGTFHIYQLDKENEEGQTLKTKAINFFN